MSTLKTKLSRLAPPGPPSSAADGAQSASKLDTIADLKSRMDRILGRPVAPSCPPADPGISTLPFVVEDLDVGTVCYRRKVVGPTYAVGRVPVEGAARASSQVMALLALEPALEPRSTAGALYLDTETTGLGGSGTLAFLVGLAWFEDQHLVHEQLLLRRPGDEVPMLNLIRQRVERASMLVTFNGKSFDWPLLETRFVMNKLPPVDPPAHLDLLHVGRRLHKARIGSCRLKTLESEVLGFVRGEDIDGADVAPRYHHYLRTGDDDVLRAVVDHNLWDITSMAALVALYGEPLSGLHPEDLLGLASTFKRAKDLARAQQAADTAVRRGAGPEALRVRGKIAKARGDRAKALEDFERLAQDVDEPDVRLELAKIYEHYVKDAEAALGMVARGTGESTEATERRRARLERKVKRRKQPVRRRTKAAPARHRRASSDK